MHPSGQIPAYEFGFRRRESAGPRLGVLAGLQDDRAARPARPAVPRAHIPEAADQFHVVGQPQGRRRASTFSRAAFSGSTTSACSTARSRCPAAAVWNRPTARRGWRSIASRCSPWPWNWPREDPAYEDVASKFFEHFVAIADAMNTLGGTGLWDEEDGFYYDQLQVDGRADRLAIRSLVGLIPLMAVEVWRTRSSPGCPASASGCSGFSTTAAT